MNAPARIVAVDVGNTSIKFGEFFRPLAPATTGPARVLRLPSTTHDWQELETWLGDEPCEFHLISVSPPADRRLTQWLSTQRRERELRRLRHEDFGLSIDVLEPQRVGLDRLAAAAAALRLKDPRRAAIVIDAGSAITVDLVAPAGTFLGGAIFPGWPTMTQSLVERTQLLPLIDYTRFDSAPPIVGRSTEQAITSGLYWGMIGAVRQLMQQMSQDWDPPPELILAGGDLEILRPHLDPHLRCVPDLVIRGIVCAAIDSGDSQC